MNRFLIRKKKTVSGQRRQFIKHMDMWAHIEIYSKLISGTMSYSIQLDVNEKHYNGTDNRINL